MTFDFALPDPSSRSALRLRLDALYRRAEADCVADLIPGARLDSAALERVRDDAARLVEAVRAKRTRSGGVDALMREFSLSSEEGVALMCLAEALLRIPDSGTRDALIRDKIGGGDWEAHLGRSPSLFVNAAAWGLLVTGKLVSTHSTDGLGSALARLVTRGGEPLIRKGVDLAMRMLGRQFVTGETIEDALANGADNAARGYRYSFDMLGEAALTESDAQRYLASYEHAIDAIGAAAAKLDVPPGQRVRMGPGISIKLSALHPRYSRFQRQRVLSELLPRTKALALRAKSFDIGLNIDAEESERLDLSLEILESLATDPDLYGWNGLGFVIQAYQKRAPAVIDFVVDLARRTQPAAQRSIMIRLVKGAYWDSEIKRAQIEGQTDYPVYTRKVHTDVAYQACAARLLKAADVLYPQFATHNAYTLAWVREAARGLGVAEDRYEFQCLHGMGETLYDQVVDKRHHPGPLACRIYAPVGSHETLLAYLVRRLLENGANSSFVNRIVDEAVSIAELSADPVVQAEAGGGRPHSHIPLPPQLYPDGRTNSAGFDWANETRLEEAEAALRPWMSARWQATPLVAAPRDTSGDAMAVRNPSDLKDALGTVLLADSATVASAVEAALQSDWSTQSVAHRAHVLLQCADALEAHRIELIALAMREAGKTFANAIGEVREAVDFCRYYAAQISAAPSASTPHGGPLVCISPWNFPLAIFTGQVVAALAAGRTVLAKPAEQTPLIAARAVQLFHAAGVPRDALQYLPGTGETVGAALVAHPGIGGVLFTGSTEVARLIERVLAARDDDPVLIAETGGQNAMVVDSSALAEQVVQDVISSAFDSAGQRCSALRVLCLQEEAAEPMLHMLFGALNELSVGNPAQLCKDIGPVIDAEARDRLEAHVAAMRERGHRVTRLALPDDCRDGTFVAPTVIEIGSIADLPGEVFGPVLHVLRYPFGGIEALVDAVNATGYGLTMGVHSRIEEHIERVRRRAHVGNLYVNRNMVGAVVGVQPFGGEGLSGTGPKAGGPLYLARLGGPLGAELSGTVATPADARLDAVRRTLMSVDTLSPIDRVTLDAWCDAAPRASLNGRLCSLPGPTGEINTLSFRARPVVACVAASTRDALAQLIIALASGASVYGDAALLPVALHGLIQPLTDDVAIDVLCLSGDTALQHAWRARMAARSGPLVSVLPVCADSDPALLMTRLVHESTVSVNTAAAGGNASLMALTD